MDVPAGYRAVGLIGFTDKGTYDETETYYKNDIVTYNNVVWNCLQDNVEDVTPGEDDTVWEKWVEGVKGDKGDKGEQGIQGIAGQKGDKGDPGEKGESGTPGADGTTYTPTIGNVSSGQEASASIVLNEDEGIAQFNFVLPKGDPGEPGTSVSGGVTSVNGKTGAVILSASDVNALPSNGTATKATSDANGKNISQTYATKASVGSLSQLQTTVKTSVVDAINELKNSIGSGGSAESVTDSTIVFLVKPSAFVLNTGTGRYEATITVGGMTDGTGGTWDIVRSGAVLTEAESRIVLSITDVDRMDGAVKITCLEIPEQQYMMSIVGAYPDADPGTVTLVGMQEWFEKVNNIVTPFIDYGASNIASISSPGGSWTATQDCACIAQMGATTNNGAQIIVDGSIALVTLLTTSSSVSYPYTGTVYIKKGQTVATKNVSGHKYNVVFKPLLK